jgi:hypothetical protein
MRHGVFVSTLSARNLLTKLAISRQLQIQYVWTFQIRGSEISSLALAQAILYFVRRHASNFNLSLGCAPVDDEILSIHESSPNHVDVATRKVY